MTRLWTDPFDLNFRLLILGGFWPLPTTLRWKQILFSIFSFICYFSLTSMTVNQALDIYLLRNDPVRLTEDLCSVCSCCTIVVKSLLILYKVDAINDLKDKFTRFKNTRTHPAHLQILRHSDRQTFLILSTFYMMAVPCGVFWILYPGLDSQKRWRVPFPYRLPVDEWSFGVWVGLYVYQSLALVGFVINLLAVDGMFCGFVMRISAHYEIIMENLKELEGSREGAVERRVKENVEFHKDILRDAKLLQEIYSPPFLVNAACVVVMIGTAITDLVRIGRVFEFQMVQKLLYVGGGAFDAFLYCHCASKMYDKSLALSSAIYSVPWYHLRPETRKDLAFISFKCQNVPKMKMAHLFYLDMKAFVNVLKVSYDLTALLFQAVKE